MNDIAQIAADYIGRGWEPIPVPFREKGPRIKKWQTLRLKVGDIPKYFKGVINIGVLTGEASGLLIDVDLDHPLARELAPQFLPVTNSIFGRSSNRRSHWLYYVKAPVETLQREHPGIAGDKKMIVELRSSGAQTVFPGSVHPSGEEITWDDDGEPATVDALQLLGAVNALADEVERHLGLRLYDDVPQDAPLPDVSEYEVEYGSRKNLADVDLSAVGLKPGEDFNQRGDIREVLRRNSWTFVEKNDDGVERWRRPGKEDGISGSLKDGAFWCFTTSTPIPSSQKTREGYAPFAVLAYLEHGGDFGKAAKALAAAGYGTKQETASNANEKVSNQATPIERPRSARELIHAFPKLRPAEIDQLNRRGEVLTVVAPPKFKKSWAMLSLAISKVGGGHWLDTFATRQGNVLLCDNELHEETLSDRLPHVAHAMGLSLDAYGDSLFVENMRGEQWDVLSLERYFAQFQPGDFSLIVLDAIYRFFWDGFDENSNAHWVRLYNRLDAYAKRLDASFLVVHHTTKGIQGGKSITDVGAGGGAQARATDCHLVLREHVEPKCVVLESAVRSFAPIEPICLRWKWPLWQLAPELDPRQLKTDKKNGSKATPKVVPEKQFEASCEAAWQKLKEIGPATKSRWRDKAGINTQRMPAVIEELQVAERIEGCQVVTKGGKYSGFRVTETRSDGSDGSDHPT